MGNCVSSAGAGARSDNHNQKQKLLCDSSPDNHNHNQKQNLLCDASSDRDIFTYMFKIQGFSRLGQGTFQSRLFAAKGYEWILEMENAKTHHGKPYLALRLSLPTAPWFPTIKVDYNMLIYDQKHAINIKRRGTSSFTTTTWSTPLHWMIPLETLSDASSGFLINDNCIYGIEILKVRNSDVSECLSLFEDMNPVLYTWKIEGGPKLSCPHGCSEAFEAGGLKWYIVIHPKAEKESEYLSIFLKLDDWGVAQVGSGVFVEFSLCAKGQIDGKHKKLTKHGFFSYAVTMWGWSQFLSYEDLYNPSNGFLVNDTFTFEASVAVLGSLSYSGEPMI